MARIQASQPQQKVVHFWPKHDMNFLGFKGSSLLARDSKFLVLRGCFFLQPMSVDQVIRKKTCSSMACQGPHPTCISHKVAPWVWPSRPTSTPTPRWSSSKTPFLPSSPHCQTPPPPPKNGKQASEARGGEKHQFSTKKRSKNSGRIRILCLNCGHGARL